MDKSQTLLGPPIDKGILYILAGVLAVLVIVVAVEIGIDATATTGINLQFAMNGAIGN